ncbi:putative WRKY transcription factor 7 [Bienertia sinuspersici]
MAVELMVGCSGSDTFAARMEENAVREAASAGLQSVERLIKLLSSQNNMQKFAQHHQATNKQEQQQEEQVQGSVSESESEYKVVADMAVDKFKKVISLLDRTRTGHARFRRGPVSHQAQQEIPKQQQQQQQLVLDSKPSQGSAFTRVYTSSSSTQIQRLPPLPHSNHTQTLALPKPHKDSSTTIHFSCSNPTNSYISSLTGDSDTVQPSSMSSGFQITNLSQVSSAGKPPLSASTFKESAILWMIPSVLVVAIAPNEGNQG